MAKNPINKNSMKKLFDTVSPMGPEAAEKFVRELLKAGDERRRDAEKIVSEIVAASRKSAEQFGDGGLTLANAYRPRQTLQRGVPNARLREVVQAHMLQLQQTRPAQVVAGPANSAVGVDADNARLVVLSHPAALLPSMKHHHRSRR